MTGIYNRLLVISMSIVSAAIKSEKDVTTSDIISESHRIWAKIKTFWKKNGGNLTEALSNECWEKIRKEHREFSSSYPTVIKHAVFDYWYEHSALEKYISEVAAKPWTNDKERIDSYARYAELLYRATAKNHPNQSIVSAFKRDYRAKIQRDHDKFISEYNKIKEAVETEDKKIAETKRADLTKAFNRLAEAAGVSDDKLVSARQQIADGKITTERLEILVYTLAKALGEAPPKASAASSSSESSSSTTSKIASIMAQSEEE